MIMIMNIMVGTWSARLCETMDWFDDGIRLASPQWGPFTGKQRRRVMKASLEMLYATECLSFVDMHRDCRKFSVINHLQDALNTLHLVRNRGILLDYSVHAILS